MSSVHLTSGLNTVKMPRGEQEMSVSATQRCI